MKLYVVVLEYTCYDCSGEKMYFQQLLGICTSLEKAKICKANAYKKLHEDKHSWCLWNIYEVDANSFNIDSFDFEHRHDPIR